MTEEYYVKNVTVSGDCSVDNPCLTLNEAYDKCSEHDIINVDGNIDSLDGIFSISKSLTFKSKTDGLYVGILIKEIPHLDDSYGVFSIILEHSCIFKYFKFTIAQDRDTPGCPIFSLSSGYLRIENCQFVRNPLVITDEIEEKDTNLTCVLIDCEKNSAVNLINCMFESLNSSKGFIEAGQIACYNCSFKNLIMETGSVIYAEEGLMDILDCTFENCVSDRTNGGAINASPSQRLIIGGYKNITKFSGCKANDTNEDDNGYGGALLLIISGLNTLNISNVEFDEENPNLALVKANCMFVVVESGVFKDLWSKDNVPFMKDVSSSSEDFLYHYFDDVFYKLYSLKKLYNGEDNDGPSKLYVADGGSDGKDCSSSDKACSTVHHAVSLVHYHDIDITFAANYSSNGTREGIDNGVMNVVMRSGDDDVWIIFNRSSFAISCNEATFDKLKFIIDDISQFILHFDGNNVIFNSLIFLPGSEYIKGGTGFLEVVGEEISLSKCDFRNLNSSKSAVLLTGSSVKVSDCVFEYCMSSGGFGGGLSVNVVSKGCSYYDKDPELCSVQGCTFIGCKSKCGGAIYLNIHDDTKKVSVKDCSFDNNSLFDAKYKGYDLYVECDDLFKFVTKDNFPILKKMKEDTRSAYGNWNGIDINLVNFVNEYKRIDNYYVGDNGNDSNTCIDQNNACWTLNHFVEDYFSTCHKVNIYFVGRYTMNDSVILPCSEYTITSADVNSNLTFSEDHSLALYNKTTFRNMVITFISNNVQCFIQSYSSLVEFNNVTFKPESDTYTMDSMIVNVLFDLLMDGCVFDSVIHSGRFVFEAYTIYNNINIRNCTFRNCTTNSDGGGLSLIDSSSFDVNNIVAVSDCSFDSCIAGNGGALYLSLGLYSSIVVSGITFGNNNNVVSEFGRGKNIYVFAPLFDYVNYKKVFPDLSGVTDGDNLYAINYNNDGAGIIGFSLIDVLNDRNKTGEAMYYIGDNGKGTDCTGTDENTLCPNFDSVYDKVRFDVCNVTLVGIYSSGLHNKEYIYNIVGNGDSVIIINRTDGVYGFSFSINSSLSDLNVTINTSLSSNAISVSTAVLTINSVIFNPLTNDIELINSILSVEDDGHLVINNSSFNNFAGIIDGVAIHAYFEKFGSLEISGTEFNNVTTTKAKGGAIYCSIGTNTTFIVQGSGGKKTVFKRCGALCDIYHYHIIWAEEGGVEVCEYSQGGAIYLIASVDAKKIFMNGVEFGKGEEKNRGSCGYDMLIEGFYLDRVVTKSNFKFISGKSYYSEGIYYHGSTDGCSYHYATTIKELDELSESRSSSGDNDKGFPWWAILIIVLVVVLIIAAVVVVVIIICVCKRRRGGRSQSRA